MNKPTKSTENKKAANKSAENKIILPYKRN